MSIITDSFENVFTTGPDPRQVGGNLTSMNIQSATIGDLTVTGTITLNGISVGTQTLVSPAISIGFMRITSALAADMPLLLSPRGAGGLILGATPDSTAVGGNARGSYAVDMQFIRAAATQVASGTGSFIVGSQNCTAAVSYSSVLSSLSSSITGGINFCSIVASQLSDISGSSGSLIIGSSGSTINTADTGLIINSQTCTLSNSTISAIIASTNSQITTTSASCGIICSDLATIQTSAQYSGIIFSYATCSITRGFANFCAGSSSSSISDDSGTAIIASSGCQSNGVFPVTGQNSIIGSNGVTLSGCTQCFCASMNSGSMTNVAYGACIASVISVVNSGYSAAFCSNTATINAASSHCLAVCGLSANLTGNYVLAVGSNITTASNNVFIFSDSSAGVISPPNSDSFTVRATGAVAAVFYTNAGATTGVQIAAGASAWAAVSDRTLKENITPLDVDWAARTVSALPIYTYNFIGNPVEQRCIGPMAQDWAELYRTNKSQKHIDTGDIAGITLGALQNILRRLEHLEGIVATQK